MDSDRSSSVPAGDGVEVRPSGSAFVGRDRELDDLFAGLEDALSGRGRLFLLGGDPGIGKSRLADELAAEAKKRGARVLWGRCWEAGGAPAYWPWVQAIRSYLRRTDPELLREQVGGGGPDIAQMLPELHELVPGPSSPPSTDPDSARFRLFDSAASFLVNAAGAQPLVVVLDDLHAADTPSLLFLRFMAGVLADSHILLVGTYRDVELTPEHPLAKVVAELAREPISREVHLRGLSERDVAPFIRATAGMDPQATLISALHRETGGNPLFLGEAVRLLAAEGRLGEIADEGLVRIAVPPRIRDVIVRRVVHLSEPCRRTLVLGAVLGPEFSLEALGRVGDSSNEEVLDLLDEAAREGLLDAIPGSLGRFRFSHELVRETLYEELGSAQRVRLHRRAAEVLEEIHRADLESHLAELAHHFFEAARGGEPGKAVEYARRAAEQAVSSLAYEEAARLYGMALSAWELDAAADEDLKAELLLARGDAQARAADLPAARGTFLKAAGLARRTGVAGRLGRAALGYGGRFVWARAGGDRHLIPMLQDALLLLGGGDDGLRVRLLSRLACALRSAPEHEQVDALSREAVEVARRVDDSSTLAYALVGRFWATYWPENLEGRLEIADEALRVAERINDGERIFDAHQMRYITLVDLGEMAKAWAELNLMITRAEHLRQPAHRWAAGHFLAPLALLRGNFDRAEELIESETGAGEPMIDVALGLDPVATRAPLRGSVPRTHLFLLNREQGRLAEIEDLVRASIEEFPWYPYFRAALTCLLLELGRDGEARIAFDELSGEDFRALYRDNEWLFGMGLASDACSRLGDTRAAEVLYEQLRPFAGCHATAPEGGSLGALDRYLGLLAMTSGRLGDAERWLQEAIALNERMGARPWTAHTQHDLARLLLSRDGPGDRERAGDLLHKALGTAGDLGMMALRERINDLLAGVRVPAPPPAGPAGRSVFRREGEYFSIAYEGQAFRLRDSKGLQHLARLIANPGQEVHAMDLAALTEGGAVPRFRGKRRGAEAGLDSTRPGDAGELIDAEAREAYRGRLAELQEELDEAEEWADPERRARAREEMELIASHLAGSVGLGGRPRKSDSPSERARSNVTKAIKAAVDRIAKESPALGRHLRTTVRTGTFCSYTPDPRVPIAWSL